MFSLVYLKLICVEQISKIMIFFSETYYFVVNIFSYSWFSRLKIINWCSNIFNNPLYDIHVEEKH